MILTGIKSVYLFGLAGLPLNFVITKQVMLLFFVLQNKHLINQEQA
jgi:hypothetical protein